MSTLEGTDTPKSNNLEDSTKTDNNDLILDTQDIEKMNEKTDSKEDNENPETTKNCVMETQETYFENLEESLMNSKLDATLSMDESQDFHLVDSQIMEDSIPEAKEETKKPESEHAKESSQNQTKEEEEEEEDLIQGTPPEKISKQTLKRKTDSMNEPAKKQIKLSTENDNLIIEETQESLERKTPPPVEEPKEESISKSRESVEVIFDKSHLKEQNSKSIEFVEIDEEGEKIVLDSSANDTSKLNVEKNPANTTEYITCNDTKTSDVSYVSAGSTNTERKLINGTSSYESNDNEMKTKNKTNTIQVEKNIEIYVKLKCLVNVDETNKELTMREIISVNCESVTEVPSRSKNYDTSASLADISGNDHKDTSPGSVNSNPHLFQIASRHSLMSTVSSSSSASSAASLAVKLAAKENLSHFSLPRGPVKHTKKFLNDNQIDIESYDRICKEWKNHQLLDVNIFNFVNAELEVHNLSNDHHSGHSNHNNHQPSLQKIRSSTPEICLEAEQMRTPKTTTKKRGKKSLKSNTASVGEVVEKKLSTPKLDKSWIDAKDPLVGQEVFAKWSDNKYYPGKVSNKTKTKYKVAFYDGQTKLLIEDFIIPIKSNLKEGLSVYATNGEFGSCGIITEVTTMKDEIYYCVETDEGERLNVQVENIFLSPDQAQLFREEVFHSDDKSLPSTPKHFGKVTLENMMEGKRRSKRTQLLSPDGPRAKRDKSTIDNEEEPSVSGLNYSLARKIETTSSDSNSSLIDDDSLLGVQAEIHGAPNEQTSKGPENRIKSKSRSKKKIESNETVRGPIPSRNSKLFEGMSFILTCASLDYLDRYSMDCKDSTSDVGTENEDDWVRVPFTREHLTEQIQAGGGVVYDDFHLIPRGEYKNVKLITNVPNLTSKYLLCLSVGIPAYNHNWIVRCCQQNKIVKPAEEELPAGWSFDKKCYIENYRRANKKPLSSVIVMIPKLETDEKFIDYWSMVCTNAGAAVILIDKPESMEDFVEGRVVITHIRCPLWVVKKANVLSIPLLSTTWIVQCLIEGEICPYDTQERYKYNFVSKK